MSLQYNRQNRQWETTPNGVALKDRLIEDQRKLESDLAALIDSGKGNTDEYRTAVYRLNEVLSHIAKISDEELR